MLKIKHIRFREKYGEGEIPHEIKTGSGPILLTCSFPYVRDWLNEHPFKNEPNARLICNFQNGAPVKFDVLVKEIYNRWHSRNRRVIRGRLIEFPKLDLVLVLQLLMPNITSNILLA